MNKIKIVYLINSFVVGGAERGMVKFLKKLNKDIFDISVIGLMEGDSKILNELRKIDVGIVNLKARNKFDLVVLFKLYKLLREIKPHILWCSLFHSTILGRIIGKIVGISIIINWEHSENFGSVFRRFLRKYTSGFSNFLIADSDSVKKILIDVFKIKGDRIKVVHIGALDLEEFSPKKIVKNNKTINIGSIGTLKKEKGYKYLIKAAKVVIQNNPSVTFTIAGGGPMRKELERLLKKENLEKNVSFVGYVADVPRFLNHLDIYVQPSLWEGQCISVIESMACGLPIIASNVGGIPESIEEGVNGFLIEPKDYKSLADKITYLIEDKEIREVMGLRSRGFVEKKYNIDNTIKKLEEFLIRISTSNDHAVKKLH